MITSFSTKEKLYVLHTVHKYTSQMNFHVQKLKTNDSDYPGSCRNKVTETVWPDQICLKVYALSVGLVQVRHEPLCIVLKFNFDVEFFISNVFKDRRRLIHKSILTRIYNIKNTGTLYLLRLENGLSQSFRLRPTRPFSGFYKNTTVPTHRKKEQHSCRSPKKLAITIVDAFP